MPVYTLEEEIIFPHPSHADKDGLLAIGGDLTADRLLAAYSNGIFPWFNDDSPILWWSPDPRMVLLPGDFKRSKSLTQTIRRGSYKVRFDSNFRQVMNACAAAGNREEEGTWITDSMISAYCVLHDMGYAHSVETYLDDKLVGGLYGVSLGKAFFGESMFYIERDASKVALSELIDRLLEWDFHIIDVQQRTKHLRSLGAKSIARNFFMIMLKQALNFPTIRGKW